MENNLLIKLLIYTTIWMWIDVLSLPLFKYVDEYSLYISGFNSFFFFLISFSFSFSFFLFIVISFLFVQILEPAEVFILNAKTLVSIKQDFLNSNNSAPNWIRNLILCVCNLFSLLIKKQKSQILCM